MKKEYLTKSQTLSKYQIADILESCYGKMQVVPEKYDCDYYQYLDGSRNLFKGEYMGTYVWAEEEQIIQLNELLSI
ncbi:MAG: hypothetical protein IJ106_09955 [Parasporobacterium sp.]|nr:hypothetical protein [Parasporobacterium sp.]